MSNQPIAPYGGPGCYVAGHWGQYGPDRVCEIADELLGTRFGPRIQRQRKAAEMLQECGNDDSAATMWERHMWTADAAGDALNDAAPEGFYWAWEDGEFYYLDYRQLTCTECGRVGNRDDGIELGGECVYEECDGTIVLWEGGQNDE